MQQPDPIARIERATLQHLDPLLLFAERTFRNAFQHLNDPQHFEAYMAAAFSPEQFQAEFEHPGSEFWIGWKDQVLSGYCKINSHKTPEVLAPEPTLEMERIYVSAAQQGKGLGSQLLNFCKQRTRDNGAVWLWLGVWEHNTGAIAFYQKNGFEVFGSHDFWLGNDRQTDLLMRWKAKN